MPKNIIKSFSKKSGKSEKEVEKLWKKAVAIANDEGQKDNYAYIVGILKKLVGINESIISFKDFVKT